MHLVPGARSFGILFHSHHAPFDGSALKIIFDQYLAKLARSLDETDVPRPLMWGEEIENLLPSAFNVLAPSEPLPIDSHDEETPSFAHPYYAAMVTLLDGLEKSVQNPYTFRPRPVTDKWPVVRRASTRFSSDESAKILNSLKHSSGRRYTLTHLAHAALAMTLISDNPPTSEAATQNIYNLSMADCRSSLKEPCNAPEGYPGYALGVYPMHVPVSLFLGEDGNPLPLDVDTLSRTMKALRAAYQAQKGFPAAISFMAQAIEMVTAQIKQAVAANQLSPNHGFAFSSDGRGEKYLRGIYSDVAGTALLSIAKFFTAINHTDPGPIFRIWSWKGILELSADFNRNSMSAGEVEKHINLWKKFMLLVQNFNEGNY